MAQAVINFKITFTNLQSGAFADSTNNLLWNWEILAAWTFRNSLPKCDWRSRAHARWTHLRWHMRVRHTRVGTCASDTCTSDACAWNALNTSDAKFKNRGVKKRKRGKRKREKTRTCILSWSTIFLGTHVYSKSLFEISPWRVHSRIDPPRENEFLPVCRFSSLPSHWAFWMSHDDSDRKKKRRDAAHA